VVEDAVLLDDVLVARGATVTTAVLDERVVVGRGSVVGGPAPANRLDDVHVTLVGRECRVSGGGVVDAGGRLEPGTVA
jgi:glucose-1-phosphate adenylyltransferase